MDETTIKNIVKEIIRECTHNGLEVSESFISYYVRLLILDPAWEMISDQFLLERTALQRFIKFCLNQLQHERCPCLMTLRMQKYFTCNYETGDGRAAMFYRTNLKEKLFPLENEILSVYEDSDEEKEKLYKKIVYYITLLSGLGNPNLSAVYKESSTALSSVFTITDVDEFLQLDREQKQEQLIELTELTSGIRLFNRDCKKGGKGIEDLSKIMVTSLEVTNKELQKTLIEIMDYINLITTAIDVCFVVKKQSVGYYAMCELPPGVDIEDIDYAKDLLVFHRQYEIYVRQFLAELEKIEIHFADLSDEFASVLDKLHDVCSCRTAIPVHLVYPHFKELSNIWCRMQDEIILIANLNQTLINIQQLYLDLQHNKEVVMKMIGDVEPMTDAQRLEITPELSIQMLKNRAILLDPNTIKEFEKLPLQYLGFCAWKFVETLGGLIPGNPNMGVARVKNKFYVFSTMEAAEMFAQDPKRYIQEGLLILRKKPELINLLQMYDHLDTSKNVKNIDFQSRELLIQHSITIQTDLHPPTLVDPKYMWNVWDLKRQALSMANVSKRKTKSVQTDKAGSRNDVKVQTQELREKNLQTKIDNYTNVPTLSNYIYGLRGRKDDQQFIIELTRPVEE